MSELDKIKKTLKANKLVLAKEFKVRKLGVFGSYARGEQRKNSDVDILVEFKQIPGFFGYLKMEEHLSHILKKKVDLVMKGSFKPTIGKYVMREVVYI